MAWGRGGGGPLAAGRRVPPHRHGPDGGPAVHRRPQVVRPGVDGDPLDGDGRRGLDPERGGWWVGGGVEPFPSLPSTPASAPLAAMAPPGRSRRRLGRRSPPFPSPSCGLLPSPPFGLKSGPVARFKPFLAFPPLGTCLGCLNPRHRFRPIEAPLPQGTPPPPGLAPGRAGQARGTGTGGSSCGSTARRPGGALLPAPAGKARSVGEGSGLPTLHLRIVNS